jgi:hypothetical protein
MPTTPRLILPYPSLSSAADVPADMGALAAALDAAVDYRLGTLATRPANPGHQAVLHWATDTHVLSFWDGAAWWDIGPSVITPDSITSEMIRPDSIGSSELQDGAVDTAAIQAGAVTSAKIADGTITGADISASLKPSGGAATSTEALRAIGTGLGQAAQGLHTSQHAIAGADPLPANSVGASQIQDNSVSQAKHAANSVGAPQIIDGSVGSAELAPNSVNASHIVDGSVGAAEIQDGSVGSSEIGNNQVLPNHLGPGYLKSPAKGTLVGSNVNHGGTYTIQATDAGTYILMWGAPQAAGDHQGAFGTISCNKSGAAVHFADSGMSATSALDIISAAAGETITFTINGDNSNFFVFAPWALLIRIG